MSTKLAIALALLVAIAAQSAPTFASPMLTGRVVDAGERGRPGINGVEVKAVLLGTDRVVGIGSTDGTGTYRVPLDNPSGGNVSISYRRGNYFENPTWREAVNLDRDQPDILLYKRGQPKAYYEQFAMHIKEAAASQPETAQAAFSAAASLPTREREIVVSVLSESSPNLAKAVEQQAKFQRDVSDLNRFLSEPSQLNKGTLRVYPLHGELGAILMTGNVHSQASLKASVADLKRQLGDSARVETAVTVGPVRP